MWIIAIKINIKIDKIEDLEALLSTHSKNEGWMSSMTIIYKYFYVKAYEFTINIILLMGSSLALPKKSAPSHDHE